MSSLLSEYRAKRATMDKTAAFIASEASDVIRFFIEGNVSDRREARPSVDKLFALPTAIAALDAAFWARAIALTDVLEVMPQARRDEWYEQIRAHKCPEFSASTVETTLVTLLQQRAQFLAERVDGIFRGLSGEHVTNQPQGFGKRMIWCHFDSPAPGNVLVTLDGTVLYHYAERSKTGPIDDLRCVVAKFMRRDEPKYMASSGLIEALKDNWGEWVDVDGGALRIRLYRKGTAHLEVHPDIAWRLNAILAHLYPRAIPPQFRERPKKAPKVVPLMERPLPFEVIHVLAELRQNGAFWTMPYGDNKHAIAEAGRVLESIGGVAGKSGWQFDYDAASTIKRIVASGVVPDDRAFQFYPTPDAVAKAAVEWAEIGEGHACLEPSAGLGGLAQHMPKTTHCVEVSSLRADVLRSKGYAVECADFLTLKTTRRYDRIVMNPPFDQGRWQAHLEAARGLLAPGGVLVAVLPLGARGKVEGGEFGAVFEGAFAGTSVAVVLCKVRG